MKIRMGVNELGNTLLYGFHIFYTTGGTTRITRWKASTAYIKSVSTGHTLEYVVLYEYIYHNLKT